MFYNAQALFTVMIIKRVKKAHSISVRARLHLCTVYFSVYIHCMLQGQIRLYHCPLVLGVKSCPVLEICLKLPEIIPAICLLNLLQNTSCRNKSACNK